MAKISKDSAPTLTILIMAGSINQFKEGMSEQPIFMNTQEKRRNKKIGIAGIYTNYADISPGMLIPKTHPHKRAFFRKD